VHSLKGHFCKSWEEAEAQLLVSMDMQIDISEDMVVGLMSLADYLQIKELARCCAQK
jgi:hypothetical protein